MPTVMLDGPSIAYDRFGEGEPVLLVAGLGMPALLWHQTLVPALVDAGYEVVTFDNRGMPPSSSPPGPYVIDDLVADSIALIDHLGLGPLRVVGYSMGACIAQELALARPDLVRGVALVATRARHTVLTRALAAGQIDLFRACPDTPVEFFVPFLLATLLGHDQLVDDELVRSFLEPMLDAPPWTDPGRTDQYVAYTDYDDRVEALRNLSPPCLVLTFAADNLIPPELGREVADAVPGARHVDIDGQGHYGVLLAVDELMAELAPFFTEV